MITNEIRGDVVNFAIDKTTSVSIGICAYNEEANIGNLIEHLLSVPFPPQAYLKEVLIVAGGCTDHTVSITEKLAKEDNRIKIIKEQSRNGKSSSVNTILSNCKGDIIIFESADTVPGHKSISLLLEPICKGLADATASRPIPVNGKTSLADSISRLIWEDLHHELSTKKARLSGELFAMKNGLIKQIPDHIIHDDTFIQHNLERNGSRLAYVDEAIVFMKGPATLGELFRQRRKNVVGFLQLRQETGTTEITISPFHLLKIVLRSVLHIKRKDKLLALLPAAGIEMWAHILAHLDARLNRLWWTQHEYYLNTTKVLGLAETE